MRRIADRKFQRRIICHQWLVSLLIVGVLELVSMFVVLAISQRAVVEWRDKPFISWLKALFRFTAAEFEHQMIHVVRQPVPTPRNMAVGT